MELPPAPRSAAPLPAGVTVAGWLLFTLMVIAISWTGSLLRGRPPDLASLLLWNLGWLFWATATFPVAHLARRFPLERPRLARRIATHVGLGIGVSLTLLGAEFLLQHAVEKIWPGAPRANAFLGFIVYKFHVYFVIYWMITGATRAYDYQVRFRATALRAAQLETQLAHAQLDALKTQLQPHFLFNTHHAIVSLILKHDNAAAIKMLTRLSDLLRITLRDPGRQLTPLHVELDALELYLGIQRERFRDRLAVTLDIAPAARDAEVPWLLLQPLVENALQHGLDPLPAGGLLELRATVRDDHLHLLVRDNGRGFPTDFDSARAPGIGLANTRARLLRLYGPAHTLSFHRADPHGAEVRITLPLRAPAPAVCTL